jgi:hypothetical protein
MTVPASDARRPIKESESPRHALQRIRIRAVVQSHALPFAKEEDAMARRLAVVAVCLSVVSTPAFSLEAPQVWRDPDTGCAYLLTPQGGVAPRYRRDGAPDCPDTGAGSRLVDDAARGISRGLETLQREMERLREHFRDEPPSERTGGGKAI